MTPANRIWFAVFVVLLFATGAFAGVILERTWLAPRAFDERPMPPAIGRGRGLAPAPAQDAIVDLNVNRLGRVLNLSADQRSEMRAILQVWYADWARLQSDVRQRQQERRDALRADVMKVLTPEQMDRFERMSGALLGPGRPGRGGRQGGRE